MNLKGLKLPYDGKVPILSVMDGESGKVEYATFDIIGEATLTAAIDWLLSSNDQLYLLATEIQLTRYGFPAVEYSISQLDPLMEKDGRDCWMVTEMDRIGNLIERKRLQTSDQVRAYIEHAWHSQQIEQVNPLKYPNS